ncbi:MAG: hypothetical protein WD114_06350 [Phycisphaerales bacterium]
MRTQRLAILMLISALLMHATGGLMSLHQAIHHAPAAGTAHQCDSDPTHADPQQQPAPHAPTENEDCSICLGLSLIQLVAPDSPPAAPLATAPPVAMPAEQTAPNTPICRTDHPARAPPSR